MWLAVAAGGLLRADLKGGPRAHISHARGGHTAPRARHGERSRLQLLFCRQVLQQQLHSFGWTNLAVKLNFGCQKSLYRCS